MHPLTLATPADRALRVLCIGAHADDLEIGCGGTILSLAAAQPVEICWVVLCATGVRKREALRGADLVLKRAKDRTVIVRQFRDGFLPYQGTKVKEFFEALKPKFVPDVILTHSGGDRHQDHRLVSELTWNTYRDHLILEYEIPKYDGDLTTPNVYVPMTEDVLQTKTTLVLSTFQSQRSKHWLTEETLRGLARIRGIECGAGVRFAEAFHLRKSVWATQERGREGRG
jgi:LmbE family N-acetylglucosaminyl deacetylase